MIEEALVKLIGDEVEEVAGAIYPNVIPAKAASPAAVYQMISNSDEPEMDGTDTQQNITVQVVFLDSSYATARDLADKFYKAVRNFKGLIEDVEIQGIFKEDESDLPYIYPDAEILSKYGRRLDLRIFYAEQ
jgi:hypothetical protein